MVEYTLTKIINGQIEEVIVGVDMIKDYLDGVTDEIVNEEYEMFMKEDDSDGDDY